MSGTSATVTQVGPAVNNAPDPVPVGPLLEPRRQVPDVHVIQHAADRRRDGEPGRPERRPQEGRPDCNCRLRRKHHHRRRQGAGQPRQRPYQLLPVHQRGQQVRGLQPEHVRHRSRHQLQRVGRLRSGQLRRLRRLVGEALVGADRRRCDEAPRQRQRRLDELRQLVAAVQPGRRHVPRRDALLGRVLVAAPVRHADQQRRHS